MPLRAKLVAALIAAALILVVAAFSLRALRLSQQSGLWVEHTHEVMDQTVLVQTKLLDAETGQRGYLLTGDERFLSPYDLAIESLPADLDRLEALTADNPKQQTNVVMLRQVANANLEVLREGVRLRTEEGPEAALALLRTDRELRAMQEVRAAIATMRAAEQHLLAERAIREESDLAESQWIMGVGSLIAFLLASLANVGVRKDVDERERIAATVRTQAERLVKGNQQLARTNERLAEINRDLDQFAYVASHDLKAPLRGIANLSEWVEEDLAGAMTDASREQLRLLRGRVHRMEGLIDGILAYSRAGRVTNSPEVFDVGVLLRDTVELMAVPPGVVRIADAMPVLRAEKVPFQQVWMNLIGNAMKHADRTDTEVRLGVVDEGEAFAFSVTDNGPGIDPRYHERIFGIFQTLVSRDTIEGTGIGLSVVRKLVVSRGGQVWVDSAPGAGATFWFRWPKRPRLIDLDPETNAPSERAIADVQVATARGLTPHEPETGYDGSTR